MQCIGKSLPVFTARGSAMQRNVECEALPAAAPALSCGAGSWIIRVLVCREIKHGRIEPEDVLGAVSVMDIPIDDQDPLHSILFLSVAGSNRRIVENAESHRPFARGMMTRRPHQAERPAAILLHHLVHSGYRATGCEQRNIEGFTADVGVRIKEILTLLAQALDVHDHLFMVAAVDILQ